MNNQIDLFIDLGKIINRIAAKLFWGVVTSFQGGIYQPLNDIVLDFHGRGDDSICSELEFIQA